MQMYGRNVGTNYRRMGLHQHDRLQNPILKVLLVPYHLSSGMIEVEEWSKSTREIYSGDFKKHLKSIPLEEEGGLEKSRAKNPSSFPHYYKNFLSPGTIHDFEIIPSYCFELSRVAAKLNCEMSFA